MRLVRLGLSMAIGLSALGNGAFAEDAAVFNAGMPAVLCVQVPAGFDAGQMYVLVGQYGKGLGLSPARREPGAAEFTERMGEGYTSAKLLIYYPGHKLVTAELQRDDMSLPFTPAFHKLKMIPLKIKLTRSDGAPIADQAITLIQSIPDMAYFGYEDGMVFSIYTTPAASGVTDSSGELSVKVPALLDDPLHAELKVKPGFEVYLGSGPPRDWLDRSKGEPVPRYIAARNSYPEPVAIQWVLSARISGRIEESFLTRNDVDSADLLLCIKSANQGTCCYRAKSGVFTSLSMRPGVYDIYAEVGSGGKTRQIPVETGFVLHEGEKHEIVLK